MTQVATRRADIKTIVIDTITYAMIDSVMRELKTKGYDKFNEFADELYQFSMTSPELEMI